MKNFCIVLLVFFACIACSEEVEVIEPLIIDDNLNQAGTDYEDILEDRPDGHPDSFIGPPEFNVPTP